MKRILFSLLLCLVCAVQSFGVLKEKDLARTLGVLKAELIKGHNLGESKYRSLGLVPPPYTEVSDELMDAYAREVAAAGIPAEVCRI